MEVGAQEIAVFAAASDKFSRANINCTTAESLKRFSPIMEAAAKMDVRVRGYVSCVVGCPYQGHVEPETVADVAQQMYEAGCYEISLGDTIGTALWES